jgi:hypothetical protein
VLDGLARNRLRQKADEVTGMACLKCDADLALGFEATYSRPMTGAGIDYDKRSLSLINLNVGGWRDADKDVIHWLCKLTPIHDQLAVEF